MADILEVLTEDQDAICEAVAAEYIADLTKPTKPDMEIIRAWLKIVYGFYDKPLPGRIEIAKSPDAALALATELTGEKQTTLDDCGIGDGGWVSFYDAWNRVGVLKDDEVSDLLALRAYMRVAWDTVLLDECAIVVQRPIVLCVDDNGNMHSASGPCMEWEDGHKDFAWHGAWVPERVIMSPRSYSREEYMAITNTEERRALSEAAGWEWVLQLLGGKTIDAWIDPATNLAYALIKCDNGPSLLQKQSPALKNGSQPLYVEPVHEDLRTAAAARKWQSTRLSVAECEANPKLEFGLEA